MVRGAKIPMPESLWLKLVLRPLGRLFGTDRLEPHFVADMGCLDCGHRFILVAPTTLDAYDPGTGHVYRSECPECGEMAATTP